MHARALDRGRVPSRPVSVSVLLASEVKAKTGRGGTILGKKVANEYIALGVYGLTGLGAWAAMRGGSDKKVDAKVEPKATATSDEEAAFLQNFINDRKFSLSFLPGIAFSTGVGSILD
ncbi:hypothetical protein JCM8115_001041 [Rhodotorula mucilaginosa]